MQPLNPKSTNKAQGLARAKMLIRSRLYWLQGYPVNEGGQIYWQCPFVSDLAAKKIIITTKMVSKAHRTINELLRDFPVALPKLVGDSKQWSCQCLEYLDYLKSLMKSPNEFFDHSLFVKNLVYKTKFKKYLHKTDSNQSIYHALSWLHFVDRKPLKKALEFLNIYQSKLSITNLSTYEQIQLSGLFVFDGKKAIGLINLILNTYEIDVATNTNLNYLLNYIKIKIPKSNNRKNFKVIEIPKGNISTTILEFLKWTMTLKPTQRRRVMAIINSIDISSSIIKWDIWWQKVVDLFEKIENICNYGNQTKAKSLKTLQKKLKNLQTRSPGNFDLANYVESIKYLSRSRAITQALLKLFTSLTNHNNKLKYKYPKRLDFINYFQMIYDYKAVSENNLALYISELAIHFKLNPECYKGTPWFELEQYYWGTIEATIFDKLKTTDYKRFFEILNSISKHHKISIYDLEKVIKIIAAKFSNARVIELSIFLLDKKILSDISTVVMKIAAFYDLDNQGIVDLIKIWNKFDEEYTNEDTLEVMFNTFVAIDATDYFKQLLFAGFAKQLRQDCYQIRAIQKLSGIKQVPRFLVTEIIYANWIAQYPKSFTPLLSELNFLTKTAKKKVKKIFLSDWWSKPMLIEQIETIQKQIEQMSDTRGQKLMPRLKNLQNKLITHKDITQIEQDRITTKISSVILLEKYNQWQATLKVQFENIWINFFKITTRQTPDWFFDSEIIQKLLPIIDFKSKDKQLAIKIIQNRCISKNWNFVGDKENQQFIQKLNDLGINVQAWIDGVKSKSYKTTDYRTISLSISTDPLETLNMGSYFKTCLSPASFNYFSVFANIVDINKQVIYAKNDKGKVVGRVLIGITESGGLKIFHRYSHHQQDNFDNFSLEFIKSWAQKTGLTLTQKGEVNTLVASDWYDDGAINIDHGIECLKDDSIFRESIDTLSANDFIETLQQNLAPLKINSLTFSLLLQLPELLENNKLFPILVKLAQQIKYLDIADKITLYKLSHSMEHKNYYSYFRNDVIKYQNKKLKQDKWFDIEVALLIAENNPSDALTIVRKYGRIISKNWQENLNFNTHKVAIKALNNLGRTQKALEIERFYQP